MADITYCEYSGCPLKKCERHPTKISKACIFGKGYVSVADFSGTCREYLSYLLKEVQKDEEVRKMAKSKWQEIFCCECCEYTKQKYLGKSKQSRNDVFSFLKFNLYECSECGKLNKE